MKTFFSIHTVEIESDAWYFVHLSTQIRREKTMRFIDIDLKNLLKLRNIFGDALKYFNNTTIGSPNVSGAKYTQSEIASTWRKK